MSSYGKEERSLTECDAVVEEEDGTIRVEMEFLSKGGRTKRPDDTE